MPQPVEARTVENPEGARRLRGVAQPRPGRSSDPVGQEAGAHGIFNMSTTDHLGLDQRSAVMVQIKDGGWHLAK